MKICIIFRGENVRKSHSDINRKYTDILQCWNNIKKTILDDLVKNGDEYEIAFITYPGELIDSIKEIINPKHILLYEKETQCKNFADCITFMTNNKPLYDRFVRLRCDFRYNMYISQWPKWNETGIILVNKDVHWPTRKLYADVVFIVDSTHLEYFNTAFRSNIFGDTIHGLGGYLYNNNIPFHLMYEDYYNILNHPLHSISSLEEEPNLQKPKQSEPIKDVSQWNKT